MSCSKPRALWQASQIPRLDEKGLARLFTFVALGRARLCRGGCLCEDDAGEIQFVEMRTRHFKTAKVAGMQGKFLCLAAAWRIALKQIGRKAPAVPATSRGGLASTPVRPRCTPR
eukprot:1076600-Amphidinium_carterae.2